MTENDKAAARRAAEVHARVGRLLDPQHNQPATAREITRQLDGTRAEAVKLRLDALLDQPASEPLAV